MSRKSFRKMILYRSGLCCEYFEAEVVTESVNNSNFSSLLIRNNDLPETNNRLVAYYILYDIFRNDDPGEVTTSPRDSPFLFFLYQLVEAKDYKLTTVERNFILQLLSSGTKDVSFSTFFWDSNPRRKIVPQ